MAKKLDVKKKGVVLLRMESSGVGRCAVWDLAMLGLEMDSEYELNGIERG